MSDENSDDDLSLKDIQTKARALQKIKRAPRKIRLAKVATKGIKRDVAGYLREQQRKKEEKTRKKAAAQEGFVEANTLSK